MKKKFSWPEKGKKKWELEGGSNPHAFSPHFHHTFHAFPNCATLHLVIKAVKLLVYKLRLFPPQVVLRDRTFFQITLYEFGSFWLFSKSAVQFWWNFLCIIQWSKEAILAKQKPILTDFQNRFFRFYRFLGISCLDSWIIIPKKV